MDETNRTTAAEAWRANAKHCETGGRYGDFIKNMSVVQLLADPAEASRRLLL
jgi:hypothetical protein